MEETLEKLKNKRIIVVLPCTDKKHGYPGGAKLCPPYRYKGPLFSLSLDVARKIVPSDDDIIVLSDLFGVVALDTPLPYYNFTLKRHHDLLKAWYIYVGNLLSHVFDADNTLFIFLTEKQKYEGLIDHANLENKPLNAVFPLHGKILFHRTRDLKRALTGGIPPSWLTPTHRIL